MKGIIIMKRIRLAALFMAILMLALCFASCATTPVEGNDVTTEGNASTEPPVAATTETPETTYPVEENGYELDRLPSLTTMARNLSFSHGPTRLNGNGTRMTPPTVTRSTTRSSTARYAPRKDSASKSLSPNRLVTGATETPLSPPLRLMLNRARTTHSTLLVSTHPQLPSAQ